MKPVRLAVVLTGLVSISTLASAESVDIYWIDVEGGASTLIVTPAGESVLMDAGYAGYDDRDAKRIEVVLKEAGLERIDYFIASHFHSDHVGGLATLAERVEIGQFLDHGDSVEKEREDRRELWQEYLATVDGKRHTVKPGDTIPLTGAKLTIVAAHSRFLGEPLPGGEANPLCGGFRPHDPDVGENGKSTGYLLEVGDFQFVNLGDLSWNFQQQMACPVNLLGQIDLFQVTHHGNGDDVLPQQVWVLKPTVAVMNNGPTKGAGVKSVETVMASPGLEDLWQLHHATNNDDVHNTNELLTANLTDAENCEGHWLRVQIQPDGSYTLLNSRNGYTKTYHSK